MHERYIDFSGVFDIPRYYHTSLEVVGDGEALFLAQKNRYWMCRFLSFRGALVLVYGIYDVKIHDALVVEAHILVVVAVCSALELARNALAWELLCSVLHNALFA